MAGWEEGSQGQAESGRARKDGVKMKKQGVLAWVFGRYDMISPTFTTRVSGDLVWYGMVW